MCKKKKKNSAYKRKEIMNVDVYFLPMVLNVWFCTDTDFNCIIYKKAYHTYSYIRLKIYLTRTKLCGRIYKIKLILETS